MRTYLLSSHSFAESRHAFISLAVMFIWIVGVLTVFFHHELWRDEAHCLYVAISSESLWQLPQAVKNEGHPLLWYFLLWVGYALLQEPVILKIVSGCVGLVSVVIWLRYSPFANWFKILFLFSLLPFYEYTVMARNYGISMLFFFLFAANYKARKKRPIVLAFILALLANTNVHSAIFVVLLVAWWLYDNWSVDSHGASIKELFWPLVVVFSGLIISALTIIPDQNSIVPTPTLSLPHLLSSLWQSILHPGGSYHSVFVGIPPIIRDFVVWIIVAGLFIRPVAALLLLAGAVALGLFFSIGYSGALRHQGIFFIYILTLYWIIEEQVKNTEGITGTRRRQFYRFVLYGVLSGILSIHLVGSYKYVLTDLTREMSSSKAFAQLIKENESYRNAIIIGEPDIRLESLPYYVDNRIFVPRINAYANFIKLTRDNKKNLSLGELHDVAKRLQEEEQRPVLIALGHFGLSEQMNMPFVRTEQYNRKFTWTKAELVKFKRDVSKVAEFKNDVKNERYEVYLLD